MHDVSAVHGESKGTYLWVWGALLLLTAVEVVLAYKQVLQPVRMLEVLLVLSVVSAGLITMYFMDGKSESLSIGRLPGNPGTGCPAGRSRWFWLASAAIL